MAMKPEAGVQGLPRKWSVAVQIVGTFGLAVFLVLYYVMVIQPKDARRYDELRGSVERIVGLVEQQQSLLTRQQASQIEDLYIVAVSHEVADRLLRTPSTSPETLHREIDDILAAKTMQLEGLADRSGTVLSRALSARIRNSQIAGELARMAPEAAGRDRASVVEECRGRIEVALSVAASAK